MDEEKEQKFVFDSSIVIAAMACGLLNIFINRMPFLNNLVNWAVCSFVYLLIIVGCIAVINGRDKAKKSKFWFQLVLAALVCAGLCLVWAE